MLQDKDTKKLFEFNNYFKGDTKGISHIYDIFAAFKYKSIIRQIFSHKTKGYDGCDLLKMLILFPFFGVKSVNGFLKSLFRSYHKSEKDSYYDLVRDELINWRSLLYNFIRRFMQLIKETSKELEENNMVKCFIGDDTDLSKRGKMIEGVSRIFNHVLKRHIIGYKLLTLGLWSGKSFIPLDFSLHNERGKKKDYGLTIKQRQAQYKKNRNKRSYGYKRKHELRKSKIDNLLKMIKRAVKRGIKADYLLTDAWFCSENLLASVRKIKNGLIHVISMCKMDKRKYDFNNKSLTAKSLLHIFKSNKKNIRRNKRFRAYYIEIECIYKDIPVKLFFVRLSKRSRWRLLVTTNTRLSFNKLYEIYQIRWTIEVFFKECKQHLGLGKCQSLDFDAQIASITINMLQYILLALYKRFEVYESIGGLFKQCQYQVYEAVLSERIIAMILILTNLLIEELELEIEDIEKIISLLIEKIETNSKIRMIFSPLDDMGDKIAA
jgi:hypothetical protein